MPIMTMAFEYILAPCTEKKVYKRNWKYILSATVSVVFSVEEINHKNNRSNASPKFSSRILKLIIHFILSHNGFSYQILVIHQNCLTLWRTYWWEMTLATGSYWLVVLCKWNIFGHLISFNLYIKGVIPHTSTGVLI